MNIIEAAKKVVRIERGALREMENRIGVNFEKACKLILNSEGRVIISGMGKSGAIGRKIAATLASTGTTSYFLHPAEGLHGDLGMVQRNDVVIAISKSGETDELLSILPALQRLKVPIIAMTGEKDSSLARHAQVTLDISVAEEACPHNLAPTASTTVTLVMGDALAIALLEARGFTADDFALLHPGGALGKKLLMQVRDIMQQDADLPFCFVGDTMRKAVMEMAHKRGICPVIDADYMLKGVITTGDLNRLIESTDQFLDIPVDEVMNKQPKSIGHKVLAILAYQTMEENKIIALPVLDSNDKLTGVVHLHDLLLQGIKV